MTEKYQWGNITPNETTTQYTWNLPEEQNEELEKETGFISEFVEGSRGVAEGFFKGAEGTAEFVNLAINPWISLGENAYQYVSTGKWDKDLIHKEYFPETGIDLTPDILKTEEGTIANLNSDIVAFFSNYGFAKKGLQQLPLLVKDPSKFIGLGKTFVQKAKQGLGLELAAGAVADVTAFDPEDGTAIETLVARYPSLQNPVFDFLNTEDDGVAVTKLKQALEGAGITGGLHIIIKGLSAFKTYNQKVVAKFKAKKAQEDEIIAEANRKGVIVDDAADAEVKVKIEQPTSKPIVKEVLLDEKQLAENIAKSKNADEIDLPINVKNFKSSKDTQKVIDTTVKAMQNSQKKSWSEVLTNKEVDELSSMMDMESDVLIKGLTQTDNIAELPIRVIATKKALQGLALEAKRLARLINKGDSSISTKTEFSKTLAIIANTTDELKTAIQAAARTTQAGRIKTGAAKIDIAALNDVVKSFDGNVEAFAEKMAKIDDFGAIKKIVERSFARRSWDAVTELYINGLLSGPLTQVINISSTFLETFLKPLELIAGGVATSFTKNGRRSIRLGFARYRGLIKNIDDTLISVSKALKEEDLIGDKAGRIIEQQAPKAISAANFNIKNKAGAYVFDTIGKFLRLPSRLLVSGDELFKQINYRGKLHELAVQKALTKNLKGVEFDKFVRKFEAEGFDELGRFVNEEAKQYSRVATFTEDLAGGAWLDMGGAIQGMNKHVPLFKLLLPFVRTPTNLYRHAMQRLPVTGLLQKRNLEALKAGGTARSEVIGKQLLGTLIFYKAYDLAVNEVITGRGPKNPALREAWLLTHKPYSFKVTNDDGSTSWVQYNRMDPRFMPVGIIADMIAFFDESNPERLKDPAAALLVTLSSNIASKTYLQGITELLTAVGTQSEGRFSRWKNGMITSFVPLSSFMRQTNNDEAMREVRSLTDTLENITWGDAENLPPRRNILGEIQWKSNGVFGFPKQWWAPMVVGKTGKTGEGNKFDRLLYEELAKLAATSSTDPGKGITKQSKKLTGTSIDLTDEKYRDKNGDLPYDLMIKELTTFTLAQEGSNIQKTIKESLIDIIQSPTYQAARLGETTGYLNDTKAAIIRAEYNRYKAAIRTKIINQNNALKIDYEAQTTAKRNKSVLIDTTQSSGTTLDKLLNY